MDTSLDQFIKDRKIKFPGRGGRGGAVRFAGNNRGRSNFNRGGRGFNRGFGGGWQNRGSIQRRGMNFNNPRFQRRGGMGMGMGGMGFNQQRRGGGLRYRGGSSRGQMSFRGRTFFNRQVPFGRGRPQNTFGVMRGGVIKRQPFFRQGGGGNFNNVPTKLYISNLDFGVSNQDIKELFSEFGPLRRYGVNFAQGGQSLGTAEVQYERRISAVKAVQKYNNVPLDGRPMKLAISGPEGSTTMAPRNNTPMATRNMPPMRNMGPMNVQQPRGRGVTKRLVQRSKMTLLRGGYRNRAMGGNRGNFNTRGVRGGRPMRGGPRRGMGLKRGARGGAGNKNGGNPPTQAQLDADLDAFNSKTD